MAYLSIGQVSRATGLTEDTLRYYEQLGLLLDVRRGSSGHRRYSEDELSWIGFVQRLRGTGMSLGRIRQYVDLWREGEHTVPDRKALLEAHAAEVEARVAKLQASLKTIHLKLEHYRELEAGRGGGDCPTVRPERAVPKRA